MPLEGSITDWTEHDLRVSSMLLPDQRSKAKAAHFLAGLVTTDEAWRGEYAVIVDAPGPSA